MRIGVDLGGTKIELLALDEDGQERHRERVPTPRHDYEGTVAAIAALVRRAEEAVGTNCTVGVGMPGAISPATGLVKNANSTWLNGQPFAEDLQRVLDRPVRYANDANCLALSEAPDGAAAGMLQPRIGAEPPQPGRREAHQRAGRVERDRAQRFVVLDRAWLGADCTVD